MLAIICAQNEFTNALKFKSYLHFYGGQRQIFQLMVKKRVKEFSAVEIWKLDEYESRIKSKIWKLDEYESGKYDQQ